jgi:acyl carrier protein
MDMDSPAAALAYPAIATIFEDVFQHTDALTPETTPDNVERWDSLQHIALIRTIEITFAIQLSMDEMMEIRCVGDIENVLRRHGV